MILGEWIPAAQWLLKAVAVAPNPNSEVRLDWFYLFPCTLGGLLESVTVCPRLSPRGRCDGLSVSETPPLMGPLEATLTPRVINPELLWGFMDL